MTQANDPLNLDTLEAEAEAKGITAASSSSSPPPATTSGPLDMLKQWGLTTAQSIAQEILGDAPDPKTVAIINDTLVELAEASAGTLGVTDPVKLAQLKEQRDLALSCLQDLGVTVQAKADQLAKQAVGKLFVQIADFAMQGITAAAPAIVAAL